MIDDILTVRNLSVAYIPGKYILKNVNFSIKRGTTVVITGDSGCGKSTLCSALCGLLPSVIKAEMSGSVVYRTPSAGVEGAHPLEVTETEISTADEATRVGLVGMVFQNPDDQLISTTVEDEIAFGLENLCLPYEKMRSRVDEELAYFGIEELAQKDPSRLSGGQKKIVTIASILAMRPEVLILDEPMTGLDDLARDMVHEAILRLKKDKRTLIVIEHWNVAADYADEFIDMENINNI